MVGPTQNPREFKGMTMFARVTLVALLCAAAAPAVAQDADGDSSKPLARSEISAELDGDYADLDADKDGKVTPAEVSTRLVKSAEAKVEALKKERDAAFAKLDTNGDGSVSKAEFEAKATLPSIKDPDAKPFLDRFDANKDGTISKDEFRAPTLANFDRFDKNKDGTLSVAERSTASASAAGATTGRKPAVKKTPPIGR